MKSKQKPGICKSFWRNRETDYTFKTLASGVFAFGVTVLFALYNGYLGIRLLSVWHGGICVFYILLAAIRGIILLTEKNNRQRDWIQREKHRRKTFVISGCLLFILDLALAFPVSLMVIMKKPVDMTLIPAIIMAVYTTCKVTMASIHIRRQIRSNQSNILVAQLRTINFIDALVSILTLQNTLIMVNRADQGGSDMLILSAVSSAVIYTVIIFITVSLLVKGLKKTREKGFRQSDAPRPQ